jgi:hypothetical protein
MLTFRLKYLFCFVLVVGVALMWWTWANGTDETANRLLVARERSKTVNLPMAYNDVCDSLGLPPKLMSKAIISAAYIFDVGNNGLSRGLDPGLWLDCSVIFQYDSAGYVHRVEWHADWPTIEAKAAEENWTFYRQVIVTVLAVIAIGWVAVTGRRK